MKAYLGSHSADPFEIKIKASENSTIWETTFHDRFDWTKRLLDSISVGQKR